MLKSKNISPDKDHAKSSTNVVDDSFLQESLENNPNEVY